MKHRCISTKQIAKIRREKISIAMMQGLLSGRIFDVNTGGEFWAQPKETSKTAVTLADALIKELNKK